MTVNENKIREQAVSWFLRIQEGNMSDDENLQWRNWQQQSKEHRLAYRKVELTWQDLDLARDISLPAKEGKAIRTFFEQSVSGIRSWYWAGAVAVMSTIIIGSYLFLDNWERAFIESNPSEVVQTAMGEHKQLNLPDGSTVEIGAKSIVSINYSSDVRKLTLFKGEALFTVKEDAQRPFIVDIGGGQVKAVGTQFNIHRSNFELLVAVVDGIVELNKKQGFNTTGNMDFFADSKQNLRIIAASQQVRIDKNGVMGPVKEVDIDRVISWQNNILSFENRPLEEVVADINRYSDWEIIIMDMDQRNRTVTGTFFVGQLDNWLTGMEQAYSLKVEKLPDNKIVIY